ncbi:TauD/TfdA family dioxygenase [Burkholderia vietnamiensis]|uniref:TauD/TfdA family dioxygenase n=1 Tax=Burkholderia vietnamiensis TaxID=60552 RepID=UPI000A456710|nr:TauD/TfdA family dioxygenase [Burkholderia vietnamiensis]MDN7924682.1 TauD/TfdA family dioxygenase [Burkholderia vietnamiensis]HDR9057742.1 TauD/TfdA family dioxygenase [Burkholderia vietnamiensis]HDR9249728.1 TauD/TfdA family dioxygenase [Burkholderia vietnamiensis]
MKHAVIEMRLSWTVSMAWHTLLANTHVSEECFLRPSQDLGEQAAEILPQSIVDTLRTFNDDPDRYALILRNCPVDRSLPPTPYSGVLSPAQSPISCLVNLTLFQLLGISPVVYEGENGGRLFRHVVPTRGAAMAKSSHGARVRFGYHVDNPDLPLSAEPITNLSACPEYLSLFGMRCDPSVGTTLVPTRSVLSRLSPDVLNVLASPRFVISRPASFGSARETDGLPLIVKAANGQWLCRFDTENTRAMDVEGARAIAALRAVLETRELDIGLLLLPGDFLIFKNQLVLHARDAFVPLDDGVDRWLMRLFGMADLARTRPATTGRVFEIAA